MIGVPRLGRHRKQMDRIEAQTRYRPDQIKVLFVGESPPKGERYFYCGNNFLLDEIRLSLELGQRTDAQFLEEFKKRGWYFDDLIQTPVENRNELGKKRRETIDNLADRIRTYKPSIVVCLLLRIMDDVETAVLMAGSDAPVYGVAFPPQQRRRFRDKMRLLRPRLERA